jgi:DNA modification methylase
MKIQTDQYTIYNDDCIHRMHKLNEEGFKSDLSVFSPPFSSLYAYTNDLHDMGNSKESDDEFKLHFTFFAKAIFKIIKEGRNMCVHVQNPSRSMENHGRRGIWDMRGEMIRIFEKAGFWYYGEVSIFKNPQAQSIRTKAQALTFSQFIKDSSISRPALLDYLMIFKVPGKSEVPCTNEIQINEHGAKERSDVTNNDWIEWANGIWSSNDDAFKLPYPVWFNVRETETLNKGNAREEKDEKHICPLQLDLIERCVKLWSNTGETVFSPFGGIGSEGYISVLNDRKSVSVELKESYFNENIKNHKKAVDLRKNKDSQLLMF